MVWSRIIGGICATCLCLIAACAAFGPSGKSTYDDACAQCHGAEGLGDGPFADDLLKSPSDLSNLASRSGGVFPNDYVVEVINGYARGDRFSGAMPDYSKTLSQDDRRLSNLVDYLILLQR